MGPFYKVTKRIFNMDVDMKLLLRIIPKKYLYLQKQNSLYIFNVIFNKKCIFTRS